MWPIPTDGMIALFSMCRTANSWLSWDLFPISLLCKWGGGEQIISIGKVWSFLSHHKVERLERKRFQERKIFTLLHIKNNKIMKGSVIGQNASEIDHRHLQDEDWKRGDFKRVNCLQFFFLANVKQALVFFCLTTLPWTHFYPAL